MNDPEEDRIVPHTWRDYLKDAKETGRVFRWVLKELSTSYSRYWFKRFITALVTATAFASIQPWLITYVFNGLVSRDINLVLFGITSFVLFLLGQRIADYYQAVAREWFFGVTWGALDRRITELFFEKSMGQHIQESSTLNVANIDKGRWKVIELQANLLFEGIPALLTLFFSYVLLWFLSWVAGATMTTVISVHLLWMLFLNQKVVEVCTPIDRELRKLNRHRIERWEKIERVKTCGKETEELPFMTDWFDKTMTSDRGFWVWFIGQCTKRGMFNIVGFAGIMGYGIWLVWRGDWALGLLYSLSSWSLRVCENIWRIGDIEHQLNWNMPSVKAMIRALSIKPDIIENENAAEFSDLRPISIVFDHVSHAYPIGKSEETEEKKLLAPVLNKVSFEIKSGEKAALIGSSGAGKTTIMRLLLRYMDPDAGSIKVNGRDFREIKLKSWMDVIGYIPQQAQIFDGTIRYNLTYGLSLREREAITDEKLWELMRLLKIDFGDRLIDGLDTVVGRNGIKLSGGQAQRLMIGAAVIKKPRFMIIDEATSSLDSSTEKAVQEGLNEVFKGKIGALIVAHRLSTVRYLCDKFIVLKSPEDLNDNGESQIEAEAHSFEKLYQISPTFRRLADDQGIII